MCIFYLVRSCHEHVAAYMYLCHRCQSRPSKIWSPRTIRGCCMWPPHAATSPTPKPQLCYVFWPSDGLQVAYNSCERFLARNSQNWVSNQWHASCPKLNRSVRMGSTLTMPNTNPAHSAIGEVCTKLWMLKLHWWRTPFHMWQPRDIRQKTRSDVSGGKQRD